MTDERNIPSRKVSPVAWVPTLYFAMGMPFVVLNMVCTLMYKGMGVSDAQIAFWTSLIMLPWTLKPLWSPFLEMYKTKKFFVVLTQLVSGIGFALVAFALHLPDFFAITIAILAVIALSGATHDIAADGTYMSVLSKEEQAKWIGWQGAFYNIAKIAATGGLVYLAGVFIKHFGVTTAWMAIMLIIAVIMCALGLYHIFILPATPNATSAEQGLGLSEQEIGLCYGTFGAAAFVIGSILAGYYIAHRGLQKSLFQLALVFNLPFVAYTFLAIYQSTSVVLIGSAITLEYFGYGFGFVGLTLFMMQQIAPGKHQMSHFAFASGIMNLGVMLPGMLSGYLSDALGYRTFFLVVLLCAIPALLITWFVPFTYPEPKK